MDQRTANHPVSPDTRELPLNEEIARQAYGLWEKYGRPDGRDQDIWLEAERQLLGADSTVNSSAGEPVLAKPLGDALYASATKAPPPRNLPPHHQPPANHQPATAGQRHRGR